MYMKDMPHQLIAMMGNHNDLALLRRHRRINVNQSTLSHEEGLGSNVESSKEVSISVMVQSALLALVVIFKNYLCLWMGMANNLRVMLLGMVDDPRVVLIKLADRLHNMRTIALKDVIILYSYALPLAKAQAVAQETLLVWCSLASRLGLWALKAELEDLCFAVLQV
ncbi:hypothetical protein GOBAR_AA14808 [Gossypium barbadense]|uniref:RelA/SpoT domain-containing protein n=1 Tax=Gossypium barbadense TaxID=3634 RepID=A0A2P5XR83_GOSBA|nr:hypothetical protein GOBAR_AA14808 [Gossypium barbadense]